VRLAAALEVNRSDQADCLGPVTLISADQALNDAATAERLAMDDPQSHPCHNRQDLTAGRIPPRE
jgi:hypothetical protein